MVIVYTGTSRSRTRAWRGMWVANVILMTGPVFQRNCFDSPTAAAFESPGPFERHARMWGITPTWNSITDMHTIYWLLTFPYLFGFMDQNGFQLENDEKQRKRGWPGSSADQSVLATKGHHNNHNLQTHSLHNHPPWHPTSFPSSPPVSSPATTSGKSHTPS